MTGWWGDQPAVAWIELTIRKWRTDAAKGTGKADCLPIAVVASRRDCLRRGRWAIYLRATSGGGLLDMNGSQDILRPIRRALQGGIGSIPHRGYLKDIAGFCAY